AAPTPTPTPAAAEPLPASTAGGRYAVNVGAFANLDNARALAGRLRGQGLPVISEDIRIDGKPALRLRVGPYAERVAAEQARLRVQGVSGSPASVIALDAAASAASAAPAPAAAAPAPASPAPRPAATAEVGFAVQLGAFRSEADADAVRERARGAGFVAFVQRVTSSNGPVWRVRVGPEADRATAERRRDEVIARLGGEAIVVSHP
ncbi:SPOR domain-containing protein, partial [Arenimonas composti]